MRGIGKSRLMATFVTVVLVLSMLVIIPKTSTANGGTPQITLSKTDKIMCGETIWVSGTGFTPNATVKVYISLNTTGTEWPSKETAKARANSTGAVNISFVVPFREKKGEYYLNVTDGTHYNNTETINITYLYRVTTDPERPLWGKEYDDFEIKVEKWSSGWKSPGVQLDYVLKAPDGTELVNSTIGTNGVTTAYVYFWQDDGDNKEMNYTIEVYSHGNWSDMVAFAYIPVRLDFTLQYPETATYGDEKEVKVVVKDGNGTKVKATIRIYAPDGSFYHEASGTGTVTTSVVFNRSGTWYVGTYVDPSSVSYRPTKNDLMGKFEDGFLYYATIDVASAEGTIEVDPQSTIYGFAREFHIHVEDQDGKSLDGAHVYVTGLPHYYKGTLYDKDHETFLGTTGTLGNGPGWYNVTEADGLKFTEAGTATFKFVYDKKLDEYGEDESPLIEGSTTVEVTSPDPINIIVNVTKISVKLKGNPPSGDEEWGNASTTINIKVYGRNDTTLLNASIEIVGCGVNLSLDEEEQPTDGYDISVSPRIGGTLTITVHNSSKDLTATKTIDVEGITSNAMTSKGSDKFITVGENETIIYEVPSAYWSEVHATLYDYDWNFVRKLNETIGNNTEGNGANGVYNFYPDVSELGYIVLSTYVGAGGNYYYTFDVIKIVPKKDLEVSLLSPANLTKFTAGLEYDLEVAITTNGTAVPNTDIDEVIGEILDENGTVLQEISFNPTTDNRWEYENWIPKFAGTFRITARNETETYSSVGNVGKHEGNVTIPIEEATAEFSPSSLIAGIEKKNVSVKIKVYDAFGDPIANAYVWLVKENATDTTIAGNSTGSLQLDENGEVTVWFSKVGNEVGRFYIKLCSLDDDTKSANTTGYLDVRYPIFEVDPSTIYVGVTNEVTIIAKDTDGNPVSGIYITLTPSSTGVLSAVPDPVKTDENGKVILSLAPQASGKLNVTIAQDVTYEDGKLNWTSILTDTVITVTSLKPLEISVSATPIYEGETLTVTVTSGNNPVEGAIVKFGTQTETTDSSGQATFEVPDPGVEFAVFTVTAEKTGYTSAEKSVTVIKKYEITIVGPSEPPKAGSKFTITIIAKGAPLAGATIEFNGKTYTSDGDGKVTLTAPSKPGKYTIRATYENFDTGTLEIEIKEGGIPGFELVTLIAAIGVAFILLRKRH